MSTSASTKIGHGLAKFLRIKLDYRNELGAEKLSRGESVFSVSSADAYEETEPTVAEWLGSLVPSGGGVFQYFKNLFPFLKWIHRYNLQWFAGDLVAGITVGAVVIPQSMAYAELAELPVEYGLYSSFMGVLIYWFFATSKDITIGPVAVMSTVTGNVVLKAAEVHPNIPGHVIASALSIVGGGIICFLGLVRLGWLVDFIPLVAISAFMTGSAITIACGQVPKMLGQSSDLFSTRDSPYLVVIHTLKFLPEVQIDAAMGLTALTMLYLIRFSCSSLAKRYPAKAKMYFFISTLRTAFVILLYTLISWLVNRNRKDDPLFSITEEVPRGFQHAAVPTINSTIVSTFASQIPATVIVLLIEHISISKSFGRVNNYSIDPSQEMVAIGVTNLLGPFLGAYPATGSFSRTAIKSKAGVRTPFAGVITALVVLLAIYALTAVFFYIPSASLAAVIIHAVGDLITPPNTVYQFWRISPLEVPIFFAGVIVTVFSTIENGIYTTIATSAVLLIFRIFKARGRFVAPVKVRSVEGDRLLEEPKDGGAGRSTHRGDDESNYRSVFLPIDHHDGTNPQIELESPYPGVFIYRFSEGYNYPNANHYLDYMVETIFQKTQRTNPNSYPKPGDRPWNNPGPRRGKEVAADDTRPTLKAIILDFSSVNNVDITSVQHLIDVRNQLDRYTTPDRVEWHFACITNRWTKRALAAAGFGYPSPQEPLGDSHRWKPIFSVAEIGGSESAAEAAERRRNRLARQQQQGGGAESTSSDDDIERAGERRGSLDLKLGGTKAYGRDVGSGSRIAVVHGLNRPYFHLDLTAALQSTLSSTKSKHRKKSHHHSASNEDTQNPIATQTTA